jgi:DUF1680 family protein
MSQRIWPVPWQQVRITGGFWRAWQERVESTALPGQYEELERTGRLAALALSWKPGDPFSPHIFWDSDIAKWLEAACYALRNFPASRLRPLAERVATLFERAQQPDGYLNSYFTLVAPGQRWQNLRDNHELYCAGHFIEAAVAHSQATGDSRLLAVARRLADHIGSVFGPEPGKKRGYPGHPEIELALVRLYRETRERRYLELAAFFVDERGQQPHYYDLEARARGEDPSASWYGHDYRYNQSHTPLRQQREAVGHAVRACYLYSGAADVALEKGDAELAAALERLWQSATGRRMYVTGGIGSSMHGERFTYDYDLPNMEAYAETCAAIALIFWAHRMFHLHPRSEFLDVLERALYNGALSGISLDGTGYFYVNPLAFDYSDYRHKVDLYGRCPDYASLPRRQPWFECACCPPNIARLILSLGGYIYSQDGQTIYVHLYASSQAQIDLPQGSVSIRQETGHPWEEEVLFTIEPDRELEFALALRLPAWCPQPQIYLNGEPVAPQVEAGYARVRSRFRPGDRLALRLPMPVQLLEAHPQVRACAGRLAVQRGPLVYCLEEADNGPNLDALRLNREEPLRASFDAQLLGGVVLLEGQAYRGLPEPGDGSLYRAGFGREVTVPIRLIPYYAWANRGPGDMLVWVRA